MLSMSTQRVRCFVPIVTTRVKVGGQATSNDGSCSHRAPLVGNSHGRALGLAAHGRHWEQADTTGRQDPGWFGRE